MWKIMIEHNKTRGGKNWSWSISQLTNSSNNNAARQQIDLGAWTGAIVIRISMKKQSSNYNCNPFES
ncbi:hypothetical protein WN51_14412 [Melipona quadrifasciata]|uniref:Uncharacterized protein n=1 Tax=Melipona quadrifasciata TaxID=166423 RepID=A0A0M8ZZN9_9HYME|nr:hypothetical protein WN51_14412 [Melipona quadrifasciata]